MFAASAVEWLLSAMVLCVCVRLRWHPASVGVVGIAPLALFAVLLFAHACYFYAFGETWFSDMAMLSLFVHSTHVLQCLRFFANNKRYLGDILRIPVASYVIWLGYFITIARCRGFVHMDIVFLAVLIVPMYFVSQRSHVAVYPVAAYVGGKRRVAHI